MKGGLISVGLPGFLFKTHGKMNKTTTNGYYTVKSIDKTLHFSMNAWYNLKESTGNELTDYGNALKEGSELEKAIALSDIIFAGMKAYDQEEGNEIDYNIYKIRGWLGGEIKADDINGITKAILWNAKTNKPGVGKKLKEE